MKLFKFLIKAIVFILLFCLIFKIGSDSIEKSKRLINPLKYQEYVEFYSKQTGIDKYLIYSVIKCESSFDPSAISEDGAMGLMQVMPDTFHWVQSKLGTNYKLNDLYNPDINIKFGSNLLKILLEEFKDTKTALSAYHAGRGVVNKWLKDKNYSKNGVSIDTTPYKETNYYIQKVIKQLEMYNNIYNTKK